MKSPIFVGRAKSLRQAVIYCLRYPLVLSKPPQILLCHWLRVQKLVLYLVLADLYRKKDQMSRRGKSLVGRQLAQSVMEQRPPCDFLPFKVFQQPFRPSEPAAAPTGYAARARDIMAQRRAPDFLPSGDYI